MAGVFHRPLRRLHRPFIQSYFHVHSRTTHSTCRELLKSYRQQLQAAHVSDIETNAMMAHALRPRLQSSHDVILHLDRHLTLEERNRFLDAVQRRCKGEPLAYVLGSKEFYGMDFKVTKDTLIPRNDSEILIQTLVEKYPKQAPLRILDIGTGSGCLLLAALAQFPFSTGVGIDISANALNVARRNARSHDLSLRSEFIEKDIMDLPYVSIDDDRLYQQFDVILANPPYITENEVGKMSPSALEYEPHLALFANPNESDESMPGDGLRFYHPIARGLPVLLDPATTTLPGRILTEVGSEKQGEGVKNVFESTPSASTCVRFEQVMLDLESRYRGLVFHTHVSEVTGDKSKDEN